MAKEWTIRTHLDQPLPERTLSRYLALLQQQGKVRASGATRSRLYHWIPDATPPITAEPGKAQTIIPLSPESQVIRQHLTLPLTNRKPVGYNLNFLASYRPNVDFYLNQQQRSHLFTLGQTSQRVEAAGTYARQILQRLLIDLSWNSSRLEGNTYSLLDTQRLLAQGMVHLPYLQPFDDVNKRVSRLAANIPLNKTNLAPLAFVDVPQDLYIQGLLGVYELQDVALLRDVFLWAYERSCLQYAALRQTLGEPDPFRLQYREDIRPLVTKVVTEGMTQEDARRQIEAHAMQLPAADRTKFLEIVETELLKLHAGNIARYRILVAFLINTTSLFVIYLSSLF